MSGEFRILRHEELVRELRILREKGLTKVRHLRLDTLDDAVREAGFAAPDGAVYQVGLERLLRSAVEWLGGGALEEAAWYTFGLAQGTRGLAAQDRRRKAAAAYGVGTERFRKAYEQVVIDQVAEGIRAHIDQARERRTASRHAGPSRPEWLLPVYTGNGAELWDSLVTHLNDPRCGVLMLTGPRDSGKSAVVRAVHTRLGADAERHSVYARIADLSTTKVAALVEARPDLLIIDDTDLAVGGESSLRRMFYLVNHQLPQLVAAGVRTLLVIEWAWASRFVDSYRLTVPALIGLVCPEAGVAVETIRPYSDAELDDALERMDLPSAKIDHSLTYYPGTVAILAALNSVRESSEFPAHTDLVILQFNRWIERVEDARESGLRRHLLAVLGRRALRRPGASVDFSVLLADMGELSSEHQLAEIASGLLATGGGRVSFGSPLEEEVAAAEALLASVTTGDRLRVSQPLPARIIDVAVELAKSSRAPLAEAGRERLAELSGAGFDEVGYDACVLAILLMNLLPSADLDLSGLCLQGPPHAHATPVLAGIQDELQTALIAVMQAHAADLWSRLEPLASEHASCRRGDPVLWRVTRRWARSLPIRPTLERFAQEVSPQRSWRYEDILDVSVTGTSTILLQENDTLVRRVIRRARADQAEVLADLWDGMNDGCWDQLTADRDEYVDALSVPVGFTGTLRLRDCRIQRARFGAAAMTGWDLSGCDLLLADLRSCRAVEQADFTGANWWAAILNPADRYRLSIPETGSDFADWCQNPPWTNPYHPGRWPHPFGVDHGRAGG